jgi:tRNA modification GTPase
LTPPGQAALATLAVGGPGSWDLLRSLFRPRGTAQLPVQAPEGKLWLGNLGEDVSAEVVLAVKQIGQQPWVEVHAHGGHEVVRYLIELLTARGARLCPWEELWQQTQAGPLQAAACVALTRAPTVRTARILLDQYQGALGRALDAILAALDQGRPEEASEGLRQLSRFGKLGQRLTAPWRVVVAGAPNVGKSSLANALAGYARSVVADTPGTTRDIVTTRIALDGWPIELADTAGQRETAEVLEGQGIEQARARASEADLCLWVLDASAAPCWPTVTGVPTQLIINKVDLPPAWRLDDAADSIRVSAATGQGVGELGQALIGWLVPEAPPPGAAVPFTSELAQKVEEARQHLQVGDSAAARQRVQEMRGGR